MTTIGFLHPGQMGVTLAAAANESTGSGATTTTVWASEDRSAATTERADAAGMTDLGTLPALCEAADIIVSICPPASAITVAESVAATGFLGTYIDANAISPATSIAIGNKFEQYIDGGVIGPPASNPGTTRMYLAGREAAEVAGLWSGSALDVRAISDSAEQAQASALKMAYAGWTKGQSALLLAIIALAESAGVSDELRAEWDLSQPGLRERSSRMAPVAGRKAWRFAGEMEEIADTMHEAGVPADFHRAAAELYSRLAGFKDGPEATLDDLLTAILGSRDQNHR